MSIQQTTTEDVAQVPLNPLVSTAKATPAPKKAAAKEPTEKKRLTAGEVFLMQRKLVMENIVIRRDLRTSKATLTVIEGSRFASYLKQSGLEPWDRKNLDDESLSTLSNFMSVINCPFTVGMGLMGILKDKTVYVEVDAPLECVEGLRKYAVSEQTALTIMAASLRMEPSSHYVRGMWHWAKAVMRHFKSSYKRTPGRETMEVNELMPILQGRQGCGKSTFWDGLLAPFAEAGLVMDTTMKSDNEDWDLSRGIRLFYRLSELVIRTETRSAEIKRIISATEVTVRVKYTAFPKSFVPINSFCGDTNSMSVLRDETGNRRFLVIPIESGDPKTVEAITQMGIEHARAFWGAALIASEEPGFVCKLPRELAAEFSGSNEHYRSASSIDEAVQEVFRKVEAGEEGQFFGKIEACKILKANYPDVFGGHKSGDEDKLIENALRAIGIEYRSTRLAKGSRRYHVFLVGGPPSVASAETTEAPGIEYPAMPALTELSGIPKPKASAETTEAPGIKYPAMPALTELSGIPKPKASELLKKKLNNNRN